MSTQIRAARMRRDFPRSQFPVARECVELGNLLRSARLLDLAEKVRGLEIDARVHGERCLTAVNVKTGPTMPTESGMGERIGDRCAHCVLETRIEAAPS